MLDTEHILLTFGERKAVEAAQPTKGDRSLIMRGKWKSLQEWLILTDSGRSRRGIREGLSRHFSGRGKTIAHTNKQKDCTKNWQDAI